MAVVYIARNESGDVLYVGCTTHIETRMSHHRNQSAWFDQATQITVENFDSINVARQTETQYIKQWAPPFNIHHAGHPRRRRKTNVQQRLAAIELGRSLADYVAEKRTARQTWSSIAADLSLDTEGRIDVSREALRQWYGAVAA